MFTFELVNADGNVWDVVTVRAATVSEAARTLASTGLDVRWV